MPEVSSTQVKSNNSTAQNTQLSNVAKVPLVVNLSDSSSQSTNLASSSSPQPSVYQNDAATYEDPRSKVISETKSINLPTVGKKRKTATKRKQKNVKQAALPVQANTVQDNPLPMLQQNILPNSNLGQSRNNNINRNRNRAPISQNNLSNQQNNPFQYRPPTQQPSQFGRMNNNFQQNSFNNMQLPNNNFNDTSSDWGGDDFGMGMGMNNMGSGGLGGPVNKPLSPNERVEMIEQVYQLVFNRKAETRDINYYKYSTLGKDEIIKQLLEGKEHKELITKGLEHKTLNDRAEAAEDKSRRLEAQLKDQLEEFKHLTLMLDEKNRYIQQLRKELGNPFGPVNSNVAPRYTPPTEYRPIQPQQAPTSYQTNANVDTHAQYAPQNQYQREVPMSQPQQFIEQIPVEQPYVYRNPEVPQQPVYEEQAPTQIQEAYVEPVYQETPIQNAPPQGVPQYNTFESPLPEPLAVPSNEAPQQVFNAQQTQQATSVRRSEQKDNSGIKKDVVSVFDMIKSQISKFN